MNAKNLIEKIQRQREETKALQDYWSDLFPDVAAVPADQCRVWLNRHHFDTVVYGLEVALNRKSERSQSVAESKPDVTEMQYLDIVKFASACMINHERDGENGASSRTGR